MAEQTGEAVPQFLVALDFSLSKPKQIIIAGKPYDPHIWEFAAGSTFQVRSQ